MAGSGGTHTSGVRSIVRMLAIWEERKDTWEECFLYATILDSADTEPFLHPGKFSDRAVLEYILLCPVMKMPTSVWVPALRQPQAKCFIIPQNMFKMRCDLTHETPEDSWCSAVRGSAGTGPWVSLLWNLAFEPLFSPDCPCLCLAVDAGVPCATCSASRWAAGLLRCEAGLMLASAMQFAHVALLGIVPSTSRAFITLVLLITPSRRYFSYHYAIDEKHGELNS